MYIKQNFRRATALILAIFMLLLAFALTVPAEQTPTESSDDDLLEQEPDTETGETDAYEADDITFANAEGTVLISCSSDVAGTIEIPQYDPLDAERGVFVGWKGTLNGATSFIPASGTLTFAAGDIACYNEPVYMQITSAKTASVRLKSGSNGIRFTTNVLLTDWEAVESLALSLERGTLIVPEYYVGRIGGELTHAALDAASAKRLDVRATEWYASDDTTGTFAGSVANIKPNNHTLNYTAAGYVKITYTNGATAYIYAKNEASAVCTIYEIAYAAMHDRSDGNEGKYEYETSDGTYSPYSQAQLAILKDFLDHVISLDGNASLMGASLTESEIYAKAGVSLSAIYNGCDDSDSSVAGSDKWDDYAAALGESADGATGIWVITVDGDMSSVYGVCRDGEALSWVRYTDGDTDVVLVAFSVYSDFY